MRGYDEMSVVPDDPTQEEAEFLFNVYVDSTRDIAQRVTKKVLVALNQRASKPAKAEFWNQVRQTLTQFIENHITEYGAVWAYRDIVVSIDEDCRVRMCIERRMPIDGFDTGRDNWIMAQGLSARHWADYEGHPQISVRLPVESRWWMGDRLPVLKSAASSGP